MSDDDLGDGFEGFEAALALLGDLPLGSTLGYLVQLVPAVRRAQARRLIDDLAAVVGSDAELLDRIRHHDGVRMLVSEAVEAAALADTEAKLRALGRVVQTGLGDGDRLDEARFVVSIIAELQVIHVRALVAAAAVNGVVDLTKALDVSEPIAGAIGAHLARLTLVVLPARAPKANLPKASIHAGVQPLGREVLRLLGDDEVLDLLGPPRIEP